MIFYLGTHQPQWLRFLKIPLFVSYKRLEGYRTLPQAVGPWALDSGAFSEVQAHGGWTIPADKYAEQVGRFSSEIGRMEWASIQDWMCEPVMLAKTRLTIDEHQRRSVQSLVDLRRLAPAVPWAPVLQGWAPADYLKHRAMYERAGFDLKAEKIVGVGSVCRRNKTREIWEIAESLSDLRLHGFGVKTSGIDVAARYFTSTDSMAWSFAGRRDPPLPGHETRHINCANCVDYALMWRDRLLEKLKEATCAASRTSGSTFGTVMAPAEVVTLSRKRSKPVFVKRPRNLSLSL